MSAVGRPDPSQSAAEDRAGRVIQASVVVAAVLAASGAALGDAARLLEWGAVAVITAIPLARVGWLAFRWARQRDWRFAALAALLLVLVAIGPVTALLQR